MKSELQTWVESLEVGELYCDSENPGYGYMVYLGYDETPPETYNSGLSMPGCFFLNLPGCFFLNFLHGEQVIRVEAHKNLDATTLGCYKAAYQKVEII